MPIAASTTVQTGANPTGAPVTEPTAEASTTTSPPAAAATTTTEQLATTLAEPDQNPFVGSWSTTEFDGSLLNIRVDADGTFSFWDSSSGMCRGLGFGRSPETWNGTASFEMTDRPSFIDDMVGEGANLVPTLRVLGVVTCYQYGADVVETGDRELDFFYDPATDTVEPGSGGVQYTRSLAALAAPTDSANPLVGSWEATDADGTRMTMVILADGSWESTDTRSDQCESRGLNFATWSATGSGTFDLTDPPIFELEATAYCQPPQSDEVVQSPEITRRFDYQSGSDTLVRATDGTTYTRLR